MSRFLNSSTSNCLDKPQNETNKINPMWLTGFTDAEGCFSIIIEIKSSLKWRVRTSFEINLHEKDINILRKIKSFFSVGSIYVRPNKKIVVYRVSKVNELNDVIIPHFYKYPLITKKIIDFYLWSKVIDLVLKKEHLNLKGFLTILSYYASINRGLSKKVKTYFPHIKPYEKPFFNLPAKLDPYWVSGFAAGDGGFSIYVNEVKNKSRERLSYRFYITQHNRDLDLMNLFIKFFNCGFVHVRSNDKISRCDYIVQDASSIIKNIIPHFNSYSLLNIKQKDFSYFKEGLSLIKLKQHLTKEGLNKIKELSLKMVSDRSK